MDELSFFADQLESAFSTARDKDAAERVLGIHVSTALQDGGEGVVEIPVDNGPSTAQGQGRGRVIESHV